MLRNLPLALSRPYKQDLLGQGQSGRWLHSGHKPCYQGLQPAARIPHHGLVQDVGGALAPWHRAGLLLIGYFGGIDNLGVSAQVMEANATMKSIVRRDTGERYQEMLVLLADESGVKTPTQA